MNVQTAEGRTLEVHEDGDPQGLAVVFHHGTPSSGLPYAPHAELAREQGIRISGGGPHVLACAALCDERLVAVASLAAVAPYDAAVGRELGTISRPTLLLHGGDDRFVPVSHGRWLAERVPGVEARIDVGDGHLTLIERRMREVNDWLLSHS